MRCGTWATCAVLLSSLVLATAALAEMRPDTADGPSYPVSQFKFDVQAKSAQVPSSGALGAVQVRLVDTPAGYVGPRPGDTTVAVRLDTLGGTKTFYASAIRAISAAVVARIQKAGLGAIFVYPSQSDVQRPSGRDLRVGRTDLTMDVYLGHVQEVRSFALGDRFKGLSSEQRVDNPAHAAIRKGAPVTPGGLLQIDKLEDYTARLNRQPGRYVEADVSQGKDPGTAYVDFKVTEYKPWYVYTQVSNTGTKETTDFRERFGFVDHQLTNHDDILQLDYITGDFDKVHAVVGSYERPVGFEDGRLRVRLDSGYTKFDSSEVGLARQQFTGEQWHVGSSLFYNVFQYHELFVDLSAGARWENVGVRLKIPNSPFPAQYGRSSFFMPKVGLRVQRNDDTSSLFGSVTYEKNLASLADTASADPGGFGELAHLGRANPDRNFEILSYNLNYNFFLEPLLFGDSWKDPSTPETSTLAHEIAFIVEGQETFGRRLVPEFQKVAGGLYTVRGYPQSVTAGDDVVVGSFEYRFHIPRVLPVANPLHVPVIGPFRVSRQQVFTNPDWDLILRAFFDAGYVNLNHKIQGETNDTLRSTGLGLELQVKRYLDLRLDAGLALDGARCSNGVCQVPRWSKEYHFVGTLLF